MRPHKTLLVPRLVIRDRLAPKPRRNVGVEGWLAWRLLDRRGREVAGGEQHNLILNTFLERMADVDLLSSTFMTHIAVGTGSTEPAVSDTALDSEVARTGGTTALFPTRTENGVYTWSMTKTFDFEEANANLTELGVAFGSASDLIVRELFRDEEGDPVTVTKTSDYRLRITYTLTATLSPVTLTPASFDITGIGTINGAYALTGGNPALPVGDRADLAMLADIACGTAWTGRLTQASSWSYTGGTFSTATGRAGTNTVNAYTPGSHERSMTCVWNQNQGNVSDIRSIYIENAPSVSNAVSGFQFLIDEADAFTKDSLHSLTIDDLITVSWGRA